jgi:hypothetical protein
MLERIAGDDTGFGIVCAGLINPDACRTETFDRNGSLFALGLGADVSLWDGRYVQVSALPHILWGHVESVVRGVRTRNELHAAKSQIGFSAALETRVTPSTRVPLSLVAGAAARRFANIKSEMVVDGYTPFDRSYTVRLLYLGAAVSWRLAGNRAAP